MKSLKAPEVLEGPIVVWQKDPLTIYQTKLRFPGGDRFQYALGSRTNRPVIIFPITDDGDVILERQWRGGSECFVYEFPGGHPKDGQSHEEAARDELLEEVGYEAKELIRLPQFWVEPCTNQTLITPFFAKGCRRVGEQNLDVEELIEVVKVPIGDWLKVIFSPEEDGRSTKNGQTLVTTLLALPHLGLIKL